MSVRATSAPSLLTLLAIAGLACTSPSSNEPGSESTTGTASSSGDDPGEESTSATSAADSDSTGADAESTQGQVDLGPVVECEDPDALSFEELIDGAAIGAARIDDETREVIETGITDVEGRPNIVAVVGRDFLLVPLDDTGEAPEGVVRWVHGETVFEASTDGITFDEDSDTITIEPVLLEDPTSDETFTFSSCFGFGTGSSRFVIDGTTATVDGTLGSVTYTQVQAIQAERPEVDTLVLNQVPGSENDDVNVETGRLVRNAGWSTLVPADGEIASGGVDLFCAGLSRDIEPGGQLGVHSWSDGMMDGADYPHEHPAHDSQLAYFTEMLGDPLGPDFYWFTLAAAPAEDIHWMTEEEIATYQLITP